MSGESRRESHASVAIERLLELIPEIDSDLATVQRFVNACFAGEHSDLSRLEAFNAEFYVGHLYDQMALAKGYFEQIGIGPDAEVLLRATEKLRGDVRDYGEKLVRLAVAAKQDADAEDDVLRASSNLHDKAILLNLDMLAVKEAYGRLIGLFTRLKTATGLPGGVGAMVDEARERLPNPNIDNAIGEADRGMYRPGKTLAGTATARAGEETHPVRNKRPRGRPRDTDADVDRRLFEAWSTGTFTTYADLAKEKGISKLEVKRGLDRHRKRARNKSRKKPRQ